jgi:hypothetical protein
LEIGVKVLLLAGLAQLVLAEHLAALELLELKVLKAQQVV